MVQLFNYLNFSDAEVATSVKLFRCLHTFCNSKSRSNNVFLWHKWKHSKKTSFFLFVIPPLTKPNRITALPSNINYNHHHVLTAQRLAGFSVNLGSLSLQAQLMRRQTGNRAAVCSSSACLYENTED